MKGPPSSELLAEARNGKENALQRNVDFWKKFVSYFMGRERSFLQAFLKNILIELDN